MKIINKYRYKKTEVKIFVDRLDSAQIFFGFGSIKIRFGFVAQLLWFWLQLPSLRHTRHLSINFGATSKQLIITRYWLPALLLPTTQSAYSAHCGHYVLYHCVIPLVGSAAYSSRDYLYCSHWSHCRHFLARQLFPERDRITNQIIIEASDCNRR